MKRRRSASSVGEHLSRKAAPTSARPRRYSGGSTAAGSARRDCGAAARAGELEPGRRRDARRRAGTRCRRSRRARRAGRPSKSSHASSKCWQSRILGRARMRTSLCDEFMPSVSSRSDWCDQLGVDGRQERRVVADVVLDHEDHLARRHAPCRGRRSAVLDVLDDRDQDAGVALPQEDASSPARRRWPRRSPCSSVLS